jgi:hypothetical protein
VPGSFDRIELTRVEADRKGSFEQVVTIPGDASEGDHLLSVIGKRGRARTSFTVTSPAGDTTPPTLESFSISPPTVDTSAGPATIAFTARITDDLSGVLRSGTISQVRFASPSGQSVTAVFYESTQVSGTPMDGTYEHAVTIPQFSEPGTWTLTGFYLADQVGNTRSLTPAEVAGLGFPISFEVTG